MVAHECDKVLGVHDEGIDRLNGDHGSRANAYLQGRAFTDQLAWATPGHHSLPTALPDPDLRPAVENYSYVICLLPFMHEAGTRGKYPLGGQ